MSPDQTFAKSALFSLRQVISRFGSVGNIVTQCYNLFFNNFRNIPNFNISHSETLIIHLPNPNYVGVELFGIWAHGCFLLILFLHVCAYSTSSLVDFIGDAVTVCTL